MHIALSPIRAPGPLVVSIEGEVLTVDGQPIDLSACPEGGEVVPEALGSLWIVAPVTRTGGVLRVTLLLPHGPNAPEVTRFPAPIDVAQDGPVVLPPYDDV